MSQVDVTPQRILVPRAVYYVERRAFQYRVVHTGARSYVTHSRNGQNSRHHTSPNTCQINNGAFMHRRRHMMQVCA